MKKKEDIRILLIQVRPDEIADHEKRVVIENSGLAEENFVVYDALTEPIFKLEKLKQYDAVMIGGSPDSSLDDHDYMQFLIDVVWECKDENIPFLGLCYGFQIAVLAFNGEMMEDKENAETGTFMMTKTEAAKDDPVFGDLPQQFEAACGRKDRASYLPDGMVNLVSSERCPFHAAKFPNTSFYGVQFHPELWKREDNLVRINHYKEDYTMSEEDFQQRIKGFRDAPESGRVIKNFIEKFVIK